MRTKDQTAVAAETTAIHHLQQALEDLDKAREKAGEDTRQRIDEAGERIRHSVSELRTRVEHLADEWERTLERSAEDVRRELAVVAIRSQQTSASLTVLSREIRQRRAELTARDLGPAKPRS